MHKFISFNHRIVLAENAFLSSISSAALYGKGIFTTIAIHKTIPFLWEKHWRRLTVNARKVGIDLSEFSEETTKNLLLEIIGRNNLIYGRVRLTIFDESHNSVWATQTKRKTSILIQTAELRVVPANFRLTVSPYRINSASPLAGVKSCNYLENILAFEWAQAKGFNEAIRLNEKDEIASACLANIFWKKNGAIYTPDLETGCLEGTTRSFVLENYAAEVKEKKANLAELNEADEIFLTSAGIGIVKVESADISSARSSF
jgi:branched-subunit amino acid aminotransferase/4-amino-4-deoxychorismate lyase